MELLSNTKYSTGKTLLYKKFFHSQFKSNLQSCRLPSIKPCERNIREIIDFIIRGKENDMMSRIISIRKSWKKQDLSGDITLQYAEQGCR